MSKRPKSLEPFLQRNSMRPIKNELISLAETHGFKDINDYIFDLRAHALVVEPPTSDKKLQEQYKLLSQSTSEEILRLEQQLTNAQELVDKYAKFLEAHKLSAEFLTSV